MTKIPKGWAVTGLMTIRGPYVIRVDEDAPVWGWLVRRDGEWFGHGTAPTLEGAMDAAERMLLPDPEESR